MPAMDLCIRAGIEMVFKYPPLGNGRRRRFSHKFYTAPPGCGGTQVHKEQSDVNLLESVFVIDVAFCLWEGSEWISIAFVNDGQTLWTNARKDGCEWMKVQRARSRSARRH